MGNYIQAINSLDKAFNIYKLDESTNKSKILSAKIIKATILINTLCLREA